MLYESSGLIRYYTDPYKVIIEVDQGIADFYRSLVPKTMKIQRQMFPAHISVVRNQTPVDMKNWGKFDKKLTKFYYEPIIEWCSRYYWIHAFSKIAEQIREDLGLPVYSSDLAPNGFKQRFHITLGNCKES